MENYTFYKGYDYFGCDIRCENNKTITELQQICDKDDNCISFNSLGYLKYFIGDTSTFIRPSSFYDNDGLYVNKQKYNNLKNNTNTYIYQTISSNPTVYIYCHDYDFFTFKDYIVSITENYNNTQIKLYQRNETEYNNILNNIMCNTDSVHIFIQLIPEMLLFKKASLNNVYILNTEQLTRISIREPISKLTKSDVRFIDYSVENMQFYDNKDNVFYLPYQINRKEIYNYDKVNDIVLVGSMSNYRLNIINAIKSYQLPINYITGFDRERDEKLFRYKILVNVHYTKEYNIFETIRCFRCLLNRMIVVSERSINDDLLEYKDNVIFCNYEDIPNKVKKVYENYDYFYGKLFSNFDMTKLHDKLIGHLHKFIKQN